VAGQAPPVAPLVAVEAQGQAARGVLFKLLLQFLLSPAN